MYSKRKYLKASDYGRLFSAHKFTGIPRKHVRINIQLMHGLTASFARGSWSSCRPRSRLVLIMYCTFSENICTFLLEALCSRRNMVLLLVQCLSDAVDIALDFFHSGVFRPEFVTRWNKICGSCESKLLETMQLPRPEATTSTRHANKLFRHLKVRFLWERSPLPH